MTVMRRFEKLTCIIAGGFLIGGCSPDAGSSVGVDNSLKQAKTALGAIISPVGAVLYVSDAVSAAELVVSTLGSRLREGAFCLSLGVGFGVCACGAGAS